MLFRIITTVAVATALSGCSYTYDVVASAQGGRVVFAVDPASRHHPSCLRRIAVVAKDARDPVWLESVSHDDDCENRFPLQYGAELKGQHQQNEEMVPAKPLRRGIIYDVSITTGATGYGGGRFIVRTDGQIKNLPYKEWAS